MPWFSLTIEKYENYKSVNSTVSRKSTFGECHVFCTSEAMQSSQFQYLFPNISY